MRDLESVAKEVHRELKQRREEGCDVTRLEEQWEAIAVRPPELRWAEYEGLWLALENLVSPLESREPSTLEAIRALRPEGPRLLARRPSERELRDKIYGAWLGRVAGCLLGKPVEGWSRADIDAYLQYVGEPSPLSFYFPWRDEVPEGVRRLHSKNCSRGNITQGVRDDDTDYTVLGLHILETYGPGFTSREVADTWLGCLPYQRVYTAERVAYRNLVNDLDPPESATYRNPYREWIGAQIRADGWAYAAPGWPEKAAEFAFRDAVVSHVKNGIYGEMWVAAMIAAAFVVEEVAEIIRIGLSEIPAESRLAQALQDVLAWHQKEPTWEGCWERIHSKYGSYPPVHTINNACLVALGLLYGEKDFGRTVGIAVHGGWDTDCNGATAGSIIGALLGAAALPWEWIEPLHDRLESLVPGFAHNRISLLAERSLRVARQVREVPK
ncbi:MAG TPA: ADP-ribosylglycohydrolase family protein [Armatimonadetes bacterium]|nr:ADP-ribosylglycohydrolase family protein [Armatimonadota bacterium]